MPKVIKLVKPKGTFWLKCICGTVAKFKRYEIQSDRDGYYVTCPGCRRFVSTSSDLISFSTRDH